MKKLLTQSISISIIAVSLLVASCQIGPSSKSTTAIPQSSPALCPTHNDVLCLNSCCPSGKHDDQIVDHQIYLLSNNCQTKFANWVAYTVILENFNGTKRPRVWKVDPDLPAHCTLNPQDYTGANKAGRYDRGHQAPLASFTATSDWEKTNYLSNITPQKATLNQGPWMRLENAVRKLARQGDKVYVVTGPLYDGNQMMTPLPKQPELRIPTGYFKVIAVKSHQTLKVAAFIMPQSAPRKGSFCQYTVSLQTVKQKSGLTIFPNKKLPVSSLTKAIGCG